MVTNEIHSNNSPETSHSQQHNWNSRCSWSLSWASGCSWAPSVLTITSNGPMCVAGNTGLDCGHHPAWEGGAPGLFSWSRAGGLEDDTLPVYTLKFLLCRGSSPQAAKMTLGFVLFPCSGWVESLPECESRWNAHLHVLYFGDILLFPHPSQEGSHSLHTAALCAGHPGCNVYMGKVQGLDGHWDTSWQKSEFWKQNNKISHLL